MKIKLTKKKKKKGHERKTALKPINGFQTVMYEAKKKSHYVKKEKNS